MRRDMKIVTEVLRHIADTDSVDDLDTFRGKGDKQYEAWLLRKRHLELAVDAGFVVHGGYHGRLTWKGHDFLESQEAKPATEAANAVV